MNIWHLDYETSSEADLKKVGSCAYAQHPSTRMLCFAIKKNNEKTVANSMSLLREMEADDGLIYAHNSTFEHLISKWVMKLNIDYRRWRCTSAMGRRCGLPAGLADLAEALQLPQRKDARGAQLINIFCKGNEVPDKVTVGGETVSRELAMQMLIDYCVQDVEVEAAIHKKLPELTGFALEGFQFDFRMNERGVPVNVAALHKAQAIVDAYSAVKVPEYKLLTGLTPTQGAKSLTWFQERGYRGRTLQGHVVARHLGLDPELFDAEDDGEDADTVEDDGDPNEMDVTNGTYPLAYICDVPCSGKTKVRVNPANLRVKRYLRVGDKCSVKSSIKKLSAYRDHFVTEVIYAKPGGMTAEAYAALKIRASVSFAALKKIPAMLRWASPDERIRWCHLWAGAIRTHRWTGKGVQPQNFKRPSVPDTAAAYEAICNGATYEDLDLIYGPPMEVVASVMRHFIQDKGPQLNADYNAIESRLTARFCGQHDKLDGFRSGKCPYKVMASAMFGIPYDKVDKESLERFLGKIADLACGYQGAVNAFKTMAKNYGMVVSDKEARRIVDLFRDASPFIVATWGQLGDAIRDIVRDGGTAKVCDEGRVTLRMVSTPIKALQAVLSSGHILWYPLPEIVRKLIEYQDKDGIPRSFESDVVTYWGIVPGTSHWGRIDLSGGKLLENIVQAFAGDIMTAGAIRAERAGYNIHMLVHDEALCPVAEGLSVEEFEKLLCTLPSWADGIPLRAAGKEVPFYLK